jgi:hypothetical protein
LSFGAGGGGGAGGGLLGGLASAAGIGGGGAPGLEAGLVQLRLHRGLAPDVDWAELLLAPVPGGPDLPALGDEGSIALAAGDAKSRFSCTVDQVERRPGGTVRLTATNGGRLLARARAAQSFAGRTPGDIIDALAGAAGVTATVGAAGEALPRYVVGEGAGLLDHVAALAATAGRVAAFGDDGTLALLDDTADGEPVGRIAVGENLLDMRVAERAADGARKVRGEGAPDQGRAAWAWLRKSDGGMVAEAGDGDPARAAAAPWARSAAAAAALAGARQRAAARAAQPARFLVPAFPQAVPGAIVELAGLGDGDGHWRVLAVDVEFDLEGGMVSDIRAAPLAAGGGAGGALGALAGLL